MTTSADMAPPMPPEPTGWGGRREWALRSMPTSRNRNGIETQGLPQTEAEVRELAARWNAEKGDDWTFQPAYRDTTPWTLAPEEGE